MRLLQQKIQASDFDAGLVARLEDLARQTPSPLDRWQPSLYDPGALSDSQATALFRYLAVVVRAAPRVAQAWVPLVDGYLGAGDEARDARLREAVLAVLREVAGQPALLAHFLAELVAGEGGDVLEDFALEAAAARPREVYQALAGLVGQHLGGVVRFVALVAQRQVPRAHVMAETPLLARLLEALPRAPGELLPGAALALTMLLPSLAADVDPLLPGLLAVFEACPPPRAAPLLRALYALRPEQALAFCRTSPAAAEALSGVRLHPALLHHHQVRVEDMEPPEVAAHVADLVDDGIQQGIDSFFEELGNSNNTQDTCSSSSSALAGYIAPLREAFEAESSEEMYGRFRKGQLLERVRRLQRAVATRPTAAEERLELVEEARMQTAEVQALQELLDKARGKLREEQRRHARMEERLQDRLRDVSDKHRLMRRENALLLDMKTRALEEARAMRAQVAGLTDAANRAAVDLRGAALSEERARAAEEALRLATERLAQWEQRGDVMVARMAVMERQQAGLLQQRMELDALQAANEQLARENRLLRAQRDEADARLTMADARAKADHAVIDTLKDTLDGSKRAARARERALQDKYDQLKTITAGLESYIMSQGEKIERMKG
jgi:hypothetical protein